MAAFTRPPHPPLSPGRRSSHPQGKDQLAARPAKQIKKDEPFDPNELARRLEQTRLQIKADKSNRLKRFSLHIGNNGECPVPPLPADAFVPQQPNRQNGIQEEVVKPQRPRVDTTFLNRPNTSAGFEAVGNSITRVASPKFQPSSSISAFLATTSRRSHHSRPQTMVFEELHNEPQHPNPYHPGFEHVANNDLAIEEDMNEAEDIVAEPPPRPALQPKDRPDWSQRSQCGDDFRNRHTLASFRSKMDLIADSDASSGTQPSSPQQILSRSANSFRIPPGATRPDLQSKPRSLSHGDALAQQQRQQQQHHQHRHHNATTAPKDPNTASSEERRISQGEGPLPTRSRSTKKKQPCWQDALATTRQDGVTAAERHREWLEQLREQERMQAAAREREQREQEMMEARKKAKRKASFRWTLLDKVRMVVH
ncbi:MAG: hypothetical protein M1822_008586 [Bathelium mastoideum]|nr:MAG: hypothetical protein M1822_008586 [Bathelium mastoideum]